VSARTSTWRAALLTESEQATAHIVRVDPAFERIIRAVGPFSPRQPEGDSFNTLARSIVFQQLAGHAARAIYGRFAGLYDGHMTPHKVLATSVEQLRSVGLSGSKASSILDLATKTSDGTVPLEHIDELSDDEIVKRLSAVRGIGRWTAEMFMLFHLGRLDVWPVDDYGVRKGFAAIHGMPEPPPPRALQTLGDIYRPYRSIAAWYCWRAVDTVLP
jgi:DNA-3-methyladenine glycosylase II